jgi:imidazolonepropionase-like amidohydrolase
MKTAHAIAVSPLLALAVLGAMALSACSSETGTVAGGTGTDLAIVNGTLIDGTGAKPVKKAAVLIKGKRIVYAGPRQKAKISKGVRTINARGGTILPGFINTHVHQAIDESMLRAWLMGGVTTVRDMGSSPNYEPIFRFRDRVNEDSGTARLLAVGPLVTVTGGYPKAIRGDAALEVSSVADAREKVEKLIAAGCDTVKIAVESGQIFHQYGLPELSLDEIEAIVQVAHAHGKRVSAHALVNKDVELAIEGGADEIAHYDVELLPQSWIERMVAQHIDWIPTFEVLHLGHAVLVGDNLARFVRAGGTVAMGTDYNGMPDVTFDLGMPVHELEYMQEAGMTPMQVIEAATRNAARAVGHPELGVLKKGKIADVIVVDGNPLKNLELMRKVVVVVHNGDPVLSKLE